MIRLLATDLDGTLFYPKKCISGLSQRNKKFLLSFLDAKKDIIIASGRNTGMLHNLEKLLKHKLYFMGCNGSFYIDKNKKEVTNKKPLDPNLAAKFYLTIKDNYSLFCWFLLDDSDKVYYCFDENIPHYLRTVFKVGNFLNGFYREKMVAGEDALLDSLQHNVNYKIMPVFSFGKKKLDKTKETFLALNESFKDELTLALTDGSIEVTSKGVTKGQGLTDFCNEYKIDKNDVIVIGDSYNDVSMFKTFPHSFCMSHASDEVKKYANHIVDYEYQIQKYLDDESLLKDDYIKNIA